MIAAMSAHTIHNLADAIWVSGKGPESLSAVGFTFPFFFLALSLANGIGIGGGSAISRKIGADDKEGADNIAVHTIIIMAIIAAITTVTMLLLARTVLQFMGATGTALDLSVSYANIIFSGIVFTFFMQVAVSILRSEGDAKKAMYIMGGGAVLNIILDPIFIYSLDMGVAGAALATILSLFLTSVVAFYWLFIEKKTYVSFNFKSFHFDKTALVDIGRVGFPASISQMSMSLMAFILTIIVASVGGPNGVAVYTTGWRVIGLAVFPMLGVASAVTSVTGAAFGAQNYEKIKITYFYALKAGVVVEGILAVVIFIFASHITWIFTWSAESKQIIGDLEVFLRTVWLLLPTVPVGMISSGMFQGVGKGVNSLILTLIRTIVFTVPFAWFLGIYLDWGLPGIWIGTVAAGLAYMPIAYGWANLYIKKMIKQTKL
ncbi:MAG: MATE family efflux transporter [Candidatus Electryoneaceae bacterium]|nr:MATE family efflux transporter [Candidatus Electryoneaceae bacterium]